MSSSSAEGSPALRFSASCLSEQQRERGGRTPQAQRQHGFVLVDEMTVLAQSE